MSAFKKKISSSQTPTPLGTRPCPTTPSVRTISTGVPSFDDILGGGQPLGSVMVALTPDPHSSWGELLQKYFIAQGIAARQGVCVIGDLEASKGLTESCMWISNSDIHNAKDPLTEDEEEKGGKVTIAWRYENMKPFQTTVATTSICDDYSHTFDLTVQIPATALSKASSDGRLTIVPLAWEAQTNPLEHVLHKISEIVSSVTKPSQDQTLRTVAVRLSISDLGGPAWGECSPSRILHFLYALRSMIQDTPCAAFITMPHFLSHSTAFGQGSALENGWVQKIAFLTDGCISFSSFGDDPSLSAMFPTYHGFVHIHRVPNIHSLTAPSHKLSVIRGLASASNESSASGENNLGFRCTRKRFIIETLHLDVEGGVGERRTAPAVSVHEDSGPHTQAGTEHSHHKEKEPKGGPSVQLESPPSIVASSEAQSTPSKQQRPRKKVAFHSNQPDLYDF